MAALNESTRSEESKSDEYPEVPKSRARKIRLFRLLMAMGVATSITVLLLFSLLTYWGGEFSRQADALRHDFLRQKVTLARHTIQPIIEDLRQSRISRDEARLRARAILRLMTFRDENGDNYIFMSSYEGVMMVQPFEPEKELTSQWDLQDAFGTFIIRELVRAAKSNPEGGFVKYFYRRPLAGGGFEEKLACVMPIPEMECYIGTGAYMQATLVAQQRIYRSSLLTAAGFGLALLIPGIWA
jgi:signal transduction histidine kinase